MLAKVVFVALLACAVAYAADTEVAEEGKPKADAAGDKKIIRPHMHPRGGLFKGHVKPYPVGYDVNGWRGDVAYLGGGRARTTEQLLRPFRHDSRVEIAVKGEEHGPYPWETPEYEGQYNARTGASARRPVPRRNRVSLPVVHYPRGSHSIRPRRARRAGDLKHTGKPRRANTPRPARPDRIPGRPKAPKRSRKARRGGKQARGKKAGAKKGGRRGRGTRRRVKSLSEKVDRLEKTVTFALRELGRHLGRMRKLETFATKGKKLLGLVSRAIKGNDQRVQLNAQHVDVLRKAAIRSEQNMQNLHLRSKKVNSMLKKHKKAIKLIAKELQGTQKRQNLNVDNINALRKAAHSAENGIQNLDKRARATQIMVAAHRAAIVGNNKRVKQDEAQMRANQINSAALHTAATNAQAAIANLDKRLSATTKLANKEKKAFALVFKLLNAQKSEISQEKNQRKQATRKGTGH